MAYESNGDNQNALKYLTLAAYIKCNTNSNAEYALALKKLAHVHIDYGDYNSAIKCFVQSLEMMNKLSLNSFEIKEEIVNNLKYCQQMSKIEDLMLIDPVLLENTLSLQVAGNNFAVDLSI